LTYYLKRFTVTGFYLIVFDVAASSDGHIKRKVRLESGLKVKIIR